MVFGVNIFDLDFGFQIDPVNQTIKSNSVGSGHVSRHRGTSSFNYHLDHAFVVFKDKQLRFSLRRMCVSGNIIHFTQLLNLVSSFDMLCLGFGIGSRTISSMTLWLGLTLLLVERDTSITMSQRSRAGGPSIRNPIIQRNDLRHCGAVRDRSLFLAHPTGKTPPEVDFESSRSQQSLSLETNAVCNAVPCC